MPIANLLPDDYKAMRERRRAFKVFTMLAPLVVCGAVIAMLVSKHTFNRTLQARNAVAQSYVDTQRAVMDMRSAEAKRQVLLEKSEVNAALVDRVPRSCLLAMVANCLPPKTAITRFEYEARSNQAPKTAGPVRPARGAAAAREPEKPSPGGGELRIAGLAATDVGVGKFIANLSRREIVAAVSLQYSQAKTDADGVREFQILVELKSDSTLIDTPDATAKEPALAAMSSDHGGN